MKQPLNNSATPVKKIVYKLRYHIVLIIKREIYILKSRNKNLIKKT